MNTYVNPVLVDFKPMQVAKKVTQRVALEISAFGVARGYCKQNGITSKEGKRQALAEIRNKFEKYAVSSDQIKQRQLVFFPKLTDIRISGGEVVLAEPEHEHLRLFSGPDDVKGANLKMRHLSYNKIVGDCVDGMYDDAARAPDELIHVTSSGYLAPSPVERMVAHKEWFDTAVTHCYHKHCYGAFPAIKIAHGLLSSSLDGVTAPRHRVDIVHTELLSGHHNIEDAGVENIIAMTLFADGFIKYSVCSDEYAHAHGLRGLRILAFNEQLLPNSSDAITMVPTNHQFQVTLSVMVPVVIKRHVYSFVTDLVRRIGMDFERDKDAMMFAIHPGGPKIVEHVQSELRLRNDQVAISKSIFLENGNMSSATIPHILKVILEEKAIPRDTRVVCLGFGPGLTVSGLIVEKI